MYGEFPSLVGLFALIFRVFVSHLPVLPWWFCDPCLILSFINMLRCDIYFLSSLGGEALLCGSDHLLLSLVLKRCPCVSWKFLFLKCRFEFKFFFEAKKDDRWSADDLLETTGEWRHYPGGKVRSVLLHFSISPSFNGVPLTASLSSILLFLLLRSQTLWFTPGDAGKTVLRVRIKKVRTRGRYQRLMRQSLCLRNIRNFVSLTLRPLSSLRLTRCHWSFPDSLQWIPKKLEYLSSHPKNSTA